MTKSLRFTVIIHILFASLIIASNIQHYTGSDRHHDFKFKNDEIKENNLNNGFLNFLDNKIVSLFRKQKNKYSNDKWQLSSFDGYTDMKKKRSGDHKIHMIDKLNQREREQHNPLLHYSTLIRRPHRLNMADVLDLHEFEGLVHPGDFGYQDYHY